MFNLNGRFFWPLNCLRIMFTNFSQFNKEYLIKANTHTHTHTQNADVYSLKFGFQHAIAMTLNNTRREITTAKKNPREQLEGRSIITE